MNEHERIALLDTCILREPTITHNCETWHVSAHFDAKDVTFYAARFDEYTSLTLRRSLWENICDPLSMAYTYALVLDALEHEINNGNYTNC